MWLKPTSLPTAVSIAMSAVRLVAVKRGAAGGDRVQELHGEMRGIAARSAIAHAEHPAASPVHPGDRLGRRDHGIGVLGEKALLDLDTVGGFLSNGFQQRLIDGATLLLVTVQERVQPTQWTITFRHGRASLS